MAKAKQSVISVKPINKKYIKFGISGTSPLIQHAWGTKALGSMKLTPAERRKQPKLKREPDEEAFQATYYTEDGRYALPGNAFKACLINAAHKDIGLEKTLVRKALFTKNDVAGNNPLNSKVIPFTSCSDPVVQEDLVRVGQGSSDLRYRPRFDEWTATIIMEFDADLLVPEDILNLVSRAGFGAGLCEMRPEKGGEYGRFEIDSSVIMEVQDTMFEEEVEA